MLVQLVEFFQGNVVVIKTYDSAHLNLSAIGCEARRIIMNEAFADVAGVFHGCITIPGI